MATKKKYALVLAGFVFIFFLFGWFIRTLVWMDKGIIASFWRAILPF